MSTYLMLNIYLKVAHHDQTNSVGAAGHQSTGVDPAVAAVFNHLGVAQKAHHHHFRTKGKRNAHLQSSSNIKYK